MTFRVAPCGYDAAKYAVTHWHYSEQMPIGKLVKFGVWEHDRFVGAIVFGRGSSPWLLTRFGVDHIEGAELVRVALAEHETPTTQLIAEAIRQLRQRNPGLRVLVSFADEAQGHEGIIYQAGNWVYTGASVSEYYRVHGELNHFRPMISKYGKNGIDIDWIRANLDPRAEAVTMPSKRRYVMPLDRKMRRLVEQMREPLPLKDLAGEVSTGDADDSSSEGQVRSLESAQGVRP